MNNTTEITVPLNCLSVSDLNVRKIPADGSADAELKASLAAHGLLQNLVVHKNESLEGHYAVDAGRRRVSMLQELASEGVVSDDLPVPCLLIEDAAMAVEVSLIENAMRADMHILDEVEAFAKLVHEGSTTAEIAARFGMADRKVEQRLRLGNVSPVIRDVYRDGDINLETLMAFTLTSDQKVQEEVWSNLHEGQGFIGQQQVRRILLDDRLQGSSRFVEFVGIDAYEQAGGKVTRDLFADEDNRGIWLEEPHILYDLADRKLAAVADGLKGSWKWTLSALEFGWEEEGKFSKAYPIKGEFTPDEEDENDGLMDRKDDLLGAGMSVETRKEYNNIRERMEELRQLKQSRNTYSKDQRAIAGCVVTLDYSGGMKIIEGLVRPEDMPKGKSADGATSIDPEKRIRDEAGYSKKLMDDMRVERTKIVRSHLTGAFTEAFDLLLFQMCREVFAVERYFVRPLDVEMFHYGSRDNGTASIDIGTLPIDWIKETDDDVAFEKMRSLREEEKQALFAVCVGTTYKGQLTIDRSGSPEVELVVDDLGIDFATGFRPTVDNFWGRIRKARILAIAEETLGEEWADAHSGDKKGVLAKAMELAFAAGKKLPEGVSPEGRAAALAWTPAGFVAE